MYKVVVVEDEKLVRSGIVHGTNWSQINCMVAGEAADGEEGIEAAKKISSGCDYYGCMYAENGWNRDGKAPS